MGFMGWNRSLLTDSGGFQMVSLLKLAEITEEGVNFESPYDGSKCMLTPERSIEIQRAIGADIMMQLDDVVDATHSDPDMFDCVFPTRTARFGTALVFDAPGEIVLKKSAYETDFSPIDPTCPCSTCKNYTRAFLHTIVTKEPSACHLLTVHNVAHQLRLMEMVRESIKSDTFPSFIQQFFCRLFPAKNYPEWAINALASVGVSLP